MLEEMLAERDRLIELKQRNVLRDDAVTQHGPDGEQKRKGGKSVTLQSQDRRIHHHRHQLLRLCCGVGLTAAWGTRAVWSLACHRDEQLTCSPAICNLKLSIDNHA